MPLSDIERALLAAPRPLLDALRPLSAATRVDEVRVLLGGSVAPLAPAEARNRLRATLTQEPPGALPGPVLTLPFKDYGNLLERDTRRVEFVHLHV
jgi:hypothetical protein